MEAPRVEASASGPDAGYEAPRDDIERNLATWLEELLPAQRVGIHDDFFAIGGNSLIAVRFFSKLSGEYRAEFTLATLFEASTVAELAALLRARSGRAGRSGATQAGGELRSLVPIQAEGSRPPIFCMHGKGGQVIELRDLAIALGPDQPFYGLQARGITGSEPPHGSVERMAADYLDEIRELQPQGPYYLMGYSGGGIAAYEMAQRLRAAGQEVPVVIFIDTLHPALDALAPKRRLVRFLERAREQGLRYVGHRLTRQLRRRWRGRSEAASANDVDLAATPGPVDLSDHFLGLSAQYRAQPYSGRLVIFRAPTRAYPSHLGWGGLASGGFEVHVVAGDHLSMMGDPNVGRLAAGIIRAMDGEPQSVAP